MTNVLWQKDSVKAYLTSTPSLAFAISRKVVFQCRFQIAALCGVAFPEALASAGAPFVVITSGDNKPENRKLGTDAPARAGERRWRLLENRTESGYNGVTVRLGKGPYGFRLPGSAGIALRKIRDIGRKEFRGKSRNRAFSQRLCR